MTFMNCLEGQNSFQIYVVCFRPACTCACALCQTFQSDTSCCVRDSQPSCKRFAAFYLCFCFCFCFCFCCRLCFRLCVCFCFCICLCVLGRPRIICSQAGSPKRQWKEHILQQDIAVHQNVQHFVFLCLVAKVFYFTCLRDLCQFPQTPFFNVVAE